ncbi:hypothetical protein PR001_g16327 [Phytophthora rubi]|uniref:Uncharacterized protein n=1 Tax=Phytophthora rubi TaxID=129364 RepID=A0A6A3NGY1_9STRA|nr:hypothetical protein PR001_g16327 [Phytophthora rubi]KAE9043658.1 hypothetical protein PR002_g3223 [Phytophthora rubi]
MAWTVNELLRLVRAWEESLKPPKTGSGTGKKKKLSVGDLNKDIYERFGAASGGSSNRSLSTVLARKNLLQDSFHFIRDFRDNKDIHGDVDWFSLSTNEQRSIMKTAGGTRVMPMDEHVFSALAKFLVEDDTEAESETEAVGSAASESDGYTSEGDKFQQSISRKKPAPKKRVNTRRPARSSTKHGRASGSSALEEETGELKGEEKANPKRRRVTSPKAAPHSDASAKEILGRQSEGLAGFLEKRAEERAKDQERSRQEREADQRFWAEETEKDRTLLRDLFTHD